MFTRTIRSHILGKSNVKWDAISDVKNSYDIDKDKNITSSEVI